MTMPAKFILGLIALVVFLLFFVPILLAGALLFLTIAAFGLVVAVWACVLLGERWIDEGLSGFNYLDALDASLNDLFHNTRRFFA